MSISSGVWYTASVFFVALLQEFRQEYAFTAGVYSTFTVFYGVWGILAGSLLDRFGPRRVILAGGILLPAALALSGMVPGLAYLYVTHGILTPFGLALMGYVPVSVLVTRSFQEKRGLALGIASAGVGVGILAVVPFAQFIIDHAGWRMAYFGMAALAAVVILPIGLFALEDGDSGRDPGERRAEGQVESRPGVTRSRQMAGGAVGRPEWTLTAAVRSREFWLITAAFTCLNAPNQLVLTHHVAHVVESGYSKILVAGIVGLVGFVSIPGKILWGYLADRWWPEWIYAAGCATVMAGIAVLLLIGPASPMWVLYLYATLMGVGYSVSPAMTPIMCGWFFGGAHFGVIFGALNSIYHVGGATGVWMAGYAHDLTGNYRLPFSAAIASVAMTVLLVWIVAPRKVPPVGERQQQRSRGGRPAGGLRGKATVPNAEQ
jgi:MFS family permease